MAIKKYNPTSAGRRAGSVVDYRAVLTKFEPEKSLTVGKRRASGRNHHGVITAKHRGGGQKKLYRIIDFKRQKDGIPATVKAIEYDPQDAYSWNNRGIAKRQTGDKAGAIADFKKALEINPDLKPTRQLLEKMGVTL